MPDSENWAYENWLAKKKINDEGVPQWICEPGLWGFTEEQFYSQLKTVIHSGEVRALQKALWLLLQHRFHSVPGDFENSMVLVRDPKRLLKAFRQALTIEKIEHLRI